MNTVGPTSVVKYEGQLHLQFLYLIFKMVTQSAAHLNAECLFLTFRLFVLKIQNSHTDHDNMTVAAAEEVINILWISQGHRNRNWLPGNAALRGIATTAAGPTCLTTLAQCWASLALAFSVFSLHSGVSMGRLPPPLSFQNYDGGKEQRGERAGRGGYKEGLFGKGQEWFLVLGADDRRLLLLLLIEGMVSARGQTRRVDKEGGKSRCDSSEEKLLARSLFSLLE